MLPHSPAYDLVLLAHVLAALVALVAVAVAGGHAVALRSVLRAGGPVPSVLVRYFRPGVNWAGRSLLAVPVLGLALVAMSHGAWSVGDEWVTLGLVLWFAAAGLAESVLWPGERRLQVAVAALAPAGTAGALGGSDGSAGADPEGRRPGRRTPRRCGWPSWPGAWPPSWWWPRWSWWPSPSRGLHPRRHPPGRRPVPGVGSPVSTPR